MADRTRPVPIRFDEATLARIDALAAASGGPLRVKVDRSATIRALVLAALPGAEEAAGIARAKAGGRKGSKP